MSEMISLQGFAVFGVSFLMSLTSTLLNRKIVNREKFSKWQQEINKWKSDKARAKKMGDKKYLSKLSRQEKHITQIQNRMMKGQIMSMVVTMAFFLGIWQVIMFLFQGKVVAYLPFSIPFLVNSPNQPLSFFYWYLICSFMSSSIIQRIFGTNVGMGMQPTS